METKESEFGYFTCTYMKLRKLIPPPKRLNTRILHDSSPTSLSLLQSQHFCGCFSNINHNNRAQCIAPVRFNAPIHRPEPGSSCTIHPTGSAEDISAMSLICVLCFPSARLAFCGSVTSGKTAQRISFLDSSLGNKRGRGKRAAGHGTGIW